MKTTRHVLLVAVLLGFSILPAIQPLFSGQLFGADGLLHFHRLVQLDRAVRRGILYPRWLPDLGYGFGFPLFNYYAPLSYYLLLPLLWLGIPAPTALLVGFAFSLWALAVATYLWGRDLFGEWAGWVAAFAAVYTPYILNDVYQRGTLPSIWALVWLLLAAWALQRCTLQPGRLFFSIATLSIAALLLTHNITSLIGLPLLLGYLLFLGILYSFRQCLYPLSAIALGVGLAAFFWIPAFFEKEYVQIYQLYLPAGFDYHSNFISLKQLLATPRPVDPAEVTPLPLPGLGWMQVALAVAGWWPIGRERARAMRVYRWAFFVAIGGLAAMTLPISLPIWDHIPLLRFVQFPWRFLGVVALLVALMAGAGASRLFGRRPWGILAVVIGIPLSALTWLFPTPWPPQTSPTPPEQIRFEAERGTLGATSAGDYLPRWVRELPDPDTLLPLYESAAPDYVIPRLDPDSLPLGAHVLEAEYGLTRAHLMVESEVPFRMRFLWYFFPGWQGRLDGRPLPLEPDGPHGLIAADIPAGQHEVTVYFGDTPLRRWAGWLSAAAAAGFLFALLWRRQTGPGTISAASVSPSGESLPLRILAACALFSIALFAIKTFYLDRYENPFRRTLFDGRQVQGVDVPLEVNFGNRMVLMGYDLPRPVWRADEGIEVALYWRVPSPVTVDYSIGLHLVDERGVLYGQQDNQHPAYHPTSQLRPDQYARDVHRLIPWEGTPPGSYTLMVLVYDQKSGHRLDVRDPVGNPLGITTYPLARVEIRRPRRFPAVERLPVQTRWDAAVGENLRLVGTGMLPEEVEVGHSFPLILFWQALQPPEGNYFARLRLEGADGTVVAEAVQPPGRADYPTSSWARGEIVRDVWSFFVPAAPPTDPSTPVPAGTYTLHLDLVDSDSRPISSGVDLGRVRVTAPARDFTPPAVPQRVEFRLGELATLIGYDSLSPLLKPGDAFTVTLYWRADALIEHSYTVFVHFLGPDGRIYAQQDSAPGGWTRPTTGWFPGEFIRDEYRLSVSPDAPPGEYRLEVGWYDPATGQRVPVRDATGAPLGDHLLLPDSITVQ